MREKFFIKKVHINLPYLIFFSYLPYIYYRDLIKLLNYYIMNNTHKRQFRELSDSTKAKISQSLRGRSKTPTHSENISKALKTYWKGVPSKNKDVEPLNSNEQM